MDVSRFFTAFSGIYSLDRAGDLISAGRLDQSSRPAFEKAILEAGEELADSRHPDSKRWPATSAGFFASFAHLASVYDRNFNQYHDSGLTGTLCRSNADGVPDTLLEAPDGHDSGRCIDFMLATGGLSSLRGIVTAAHYEILFAGIQDIEDSSDYTLETYWAFGVLAAEQSGNLPGTIDPLQYLSAAVALQYPAGGILRATAGQVTTQYNLHQRNQYADYPYAYSWYGSFNFEMPSMEYQFQHLPSQQQDSLADGFERLFAKIDRLKASALFRLPRERDGWERFLKQAHRPPYQQKPGGSWPTLTRS